MIVQVLILIFNVAVTFLTFKKHCCSLQVGSIQLKKNIKVKLLC